MRHLQSLCFTLASLALLAPIRALADDCSVPGNLIQNCGFEAGFVGWTRTGNNTAPTAWSDVNGWYPHSGQFAAEMGPMGAPESLSQTFNDTPGASATLSFWLENESSVDLDGGHYTGFSQFSADVNGQQLVFLGNPVAQDGTYSLYTASFLATGTDTLNFTFQNDPSYFDLDDVVVQTAAPEPPSLALLGTGITAVAGLLRRRIGRS